MAERIEILTEKKGKCQMTARENLIRFLTIVIPHKPKKSRNSRKSKVWLFFLLYSRLEGPYNDPWF